MPKTFRFVYVDVNSPAMEEDRRFYTEVMGLSEHADSTSNEVWLSSGMDHHNIVLRGGESTAFNAVGLQLSKDVSIADMEKLLLEAGINCTRKQDARPGVKELLELESIGGHVVQLFSEVQATAAGVPNDGVAPLRIGHFAVASPEAGMISKLYRDILGFYHTDSLGTVMKFYTCNHEHHVLNVAELPGPHRLHHLAFQLREYASHARAADILTRDGRPIIWGPTRHTAGHNIASYFKDPSNRLIELYTDMDVYLPDLDIQEPRPWHEEVPMRPRTWVAGDIANWKTQFDPPLQKQQ